MALENNPVKKVVERPFNHVEVSDRAPQLFSGVRLALCRIPQYNRAREKHELSVEAYKQERKAYPHMIEFSDGWDVTWRVASSDERIIVMRSHDNRTEVLDITARQASGEESTQNGFIYREYQPPFRGARQRAGKQVGETVTNTYTNSHEALNNIQEMIRALQHASPQG